MFVFTAKVSVKRVIVGVCIIGAVIAGIYTLSGKTDDTDVFLQGDEVMTIASSKLRTEAEKTEYVESFGWEIDKNNIIVKDVLIPKEFNEAYTEYNKIQQKQGLDLEKYKGKKAELTTFKITNYPDGTEGVTVNILTNKGKLIAADVCSPLADGFIHGLSENVPQ